MLDLGVLTSTVDNLSSLILIAFVACQIDVLTILVVQRILDEDFVRFLPVTEIAQCKTSTRNGQFSLLIHFRLALSVLVVYKNQVVTVVAGIANGQGFIVGKLTVYFIIGTDYRYLCRTIEVHITTLGQILTPIVQMAVWHYLASKEHVLQILRQLFAEDVNIRNIYQHKGHPEHEVDLLLVDEVYQVRWEREVHLRNNHQGGARSISEVYVRYRHVEVERHLITHDAISVYAKAFDHPVYVVDGRTMRDDDAFRGACRTRGEDGIDGV